MTKKRNSSTLLQGASSNVFIPEHENNAADQNEKPKFQMNEATKNIPTPHGSNFPFVSTGLCRLSHCWRSLIHRQEIAAAFPPQPRLSIGLWNHLMIPTMARCPLLVSANQMKPGFRPLLHAMGSTMQPTFLFGACTSDTWQWSLSKILPVAPKFPWHSSAFHLGNGPTLKFQPPWLLLRQRLVPLVLGASLPWPLVDWFPPSWVASPGPSNRTQAGGRGFWCGLAAQDALVQGPLVMAFRSKPRGTQLYNEQGEGKKPPNYCKNCTKYRGEPLPIFIVTGFLPWKSVEMFNNCSSAGTNTERIGSRQRLHRFEFICFLQLPKDLKGP